MRRTPGAAAPDGEAGVEADGDDAEVDGVEEKDVDAGEFDEAKGADAVEELAGTADRTTGPEDEDGEDAGAEDTAGFEAATSCASSACQTWRLGLRASTAQASRWRASATWLSQQETEQKTRRMRLRLQVETLQTQWAVENPSSLRQALHFSQNSLIGTPGDWSRDDTREADRSGGGAQHGAAATGALEHRTV
jgi:ferredoxin